MKTTRIELLSPAKDCEVGMAAINHGADAVYIGGPDFGAREKASNNMEDIEHLCRHAALFDAKVYVTLNTLLYDNELERARKMAYDCWNVGVDALIVQDMQLLQLDLPPIPLHASTQCDNLTVEKVQMLEQLGFSQVVLGRELSIKQIQEIREKASVPLEFFVHGALCVSHSGQCYLSQYIGNRSANRGACAQPCRLPWDLLDANGKELFKNRHLLCLKDLNNSAHLEELIDAGITSFKIEGRMKDADYVKNVTAFYRQKLDEIISHRSDLEQASLGHCSYSFEVNPEKSFNRGFTDFFIHGRQEGIDAPFTPKSMGEYIGIVRWCNPLRMEIETGKTLHNGDGLCFLNENNELQGLRADVVNGQTVSCNRPHGAQRGTKIYRNYDIEWQKQVDASNGNRKIDINLTLAETETGYELSAQHISQPELSILNYQFSIDKITANNPEKATENIRKKALQWGDTVFNPVSLELRFTEPRLIPASVIGDMKRNLVEKMMSELIENHRNNRMHRIVSGKVSTTTIDPDAIPERLMTCHHCIRFANGMCSKETGQKATPLWIRNGSNVFRLEFDCRNCLMYVLSENN
ncbi:MAG: U32 family peptidase [Bacteroidales bacterium]|nr:U32 family peptidase [Bacteroidales bacterium]MBQ6305663.1 U32 family peptidase [Bacteroidales bacterium]